MEKYDVLIIGSGLGGLQCGYILSKEGYKVCIIEKNRQIGGCLQTFVRDKCIFDTGIHYMGGLDEGQNLNRYFKYFGLMDKLKLRKMDTDGFDVISFGDDPRSYKYAMGYEGFYETMCSYFPKEKAGLQKYCAAMKEMTTHFPLYELKKSRGYSLGTQHLEIGASQFIASCVGDQKLQQVLAATNVLYAGDGATSPFYMHALVVNSYIESSWRCIDGGSQIERLLTKAIKANGGSIFKYSEAQSLVCKDKKIDYVKLTNGRCIQADHFISNIHPAKTMELLETKIIRKAYRKRIQRMQNTPSVFILYLVFHKNTFPYLNYNYYHYNQADVWNCIHKTSEKWPHCYALYVPATSKSEVYADSMTVLTYMQYEEVADWADTFHTIPREVNDRGKSYEAFKQQKVEIILDELSKKFPNIRSQIKSYYTSTPLSFRDYIGNQDGSLYGVARDYKAPLKSFIAPRTKVSNLYFTGQNLLMHGVLGVTVGAVLTCSEFLGQSYLIDKIVKASE